MAHSIPSPTLIEAEQAGITVSRNGKSVPVTASMIRELPKDSILALAQAFSGEKLTALLSELCEATCITNGGREIPDNRTRLAAAIYVGNQLWGAPIQRQQIQTETVSDTDNDALMRVMASPAALKSIRNLLAQAEAMAKEVEVETVSEK